MRRKHTPTSRTLFQRFKTLGAVFPFRVTSQTTMTMTSLLKTTTNHNHHRHAPPSPSLNLQINSTPTNNHNQSTDDRKKPTLDYFRDPFMSSTAAATTNRNAVPKDPSTTTSMPIDGSAEDSVLSKSEFLTQDEVLRRRSRRLKQLVRIYLDYYWALMDELKAKYREYYWEYGKSPFLDDEEAGEGSGDQGLGLGQGSNGGNQCAVHGCKSKAMALTKFCHTHILSDASQKLYIGCNYVIKSSQAGPITCGKPILRSTVPSLCPLHFQKAEKHVARALKKAGLNVNSTSKIAPKFHVIVAEYVNQIQTKRRDAVREAANNSEKDEEISI